MKEINLQKRVQACAKGCALFMAVEAYRIAITALHLLCYQCDTTLAEIIVVCPAFYVGDVRQLLYPTDSLGNFCGQDEFR